jgi:hypothetical protein
MAQTKTSSARIPLTRPHNEALAIYAHRVLAFFGTVAVSFIVFVTAVLAVKLLIEPSAPMVFKPALVIMVGGSCGAVVLAVHHLRRECGIGATDASDTVQAETVRQPTDLHGSPTGASRDVSASRADEGHTQPGIPTSELLAHTLPIIPSTSQVSPTTGLSSDVTLGAYIEDNGTLLQVLGVFVALTVFSAALTRQPSFNLFLTGLFFVCTILIGLEARARLPRFRNRSERLAFFAFSFEGALALLAVYGIVWYHPLYRVATDAILALVLCAISLVIAVSRVRVARRLLSFIVDPPQRYSVLHRRSITLASLLVVILLLTVVERLVEPIIPTVNMWLDYLGRLLGTKG